MLAKLLEVCVGDESIPIMAIDMRDNTGKDRRRLLEQAGFLQGVSSPSVIAFVMENQTAVQFYVWGRFMARDWLPAYWSNLKDGDIIDVKYVSGAPHLTKRKEGAEI